MVKQTKFLFGDIVVVNEDQIGVILKTYESDLGYLYVVYNRMSSTIKEYDESEIERYRVRHKYLNDEEMEYQLR